MVAAESANGRISEHLHLRQGASQVQIQQINELVTRHSSLVNPQSSSSARR